MRTKKFVGTMKLASIFALILLVTQVAHAAPPTIFIEQLETRQKPLPNPAKTDETITAKVFVHFKNGQNQETEPPDTGMTYHWECTGVRKDGTAVTNPNVTVTDDRTTTMTATFTQPANEYAIDLKVTVGNTDWHNDDGTAYILTATTTLTVKVQDIVVRFSSDPVKVGFILTNGAPDTNSPIGKKTVTVTVAPAAEAGNIKLVVTGQNRISITNISPPNLNTGVFTFDVQGTSGTPVTAPGGDTTIEGQKDGVKKGEMKAIVIVPTSIQKPTPTFDGDVTGENKPLNSSSIPPIWLGPGTPYPTGKVSLRTVWLTVQTITVLDQFGSVLDSMYQGAPVTENDPINQNMSANGTYSDPTGPLMKREPKSSFNDPSAEEDAWLAFGAPEVLPDAGEYPPATVPVQVGGNSVGNITRKTTITLIPGRNSTIHMKIEPQE